ncbi:hypothetical protein BX600DRAFT_227293 [Xylariales sp. PMI_506]|nr:hypothetical protein BX600DRAFT_227293 [Xylariales sp. PMI_506]
MMMRRSLRLQNSVNAKPAPAIDQVDQKDIPANIAYQHGSRKDVARGKSQLAESDGDQGKKLAVRTQVISTRDRLSSLPPEILNTIIQHIQDQPTMSALGGTSRRLYSLMMPRLYGRIAVAAMFHAHIPKLIRTLEPHLTIAQKKQLKKEGKYKGQQEKFPRAASEKAQPICATHVRQLVVGAAEPGKKHKYIVDRYVEEAVQNMSNLEAVETRVLTKSMGECLASLQNLRALRLFSTDFTPADMEPMAQMKNIEHLGVQDYDSDANSVEKGRILKSLLLNSTSTLRSLVIETSMFSENFLYGWQNGPLTVSKATSDAKQDFTAMELLTITGMTIDAAVVKSLQNAFDFTQLKELSLGHLTDHDCLLFPSLTALFSSASQDTTAPATTGRRINLRSLNLQMSYTSEQDKAEFGAKCRFIASFNTLTTLEIYDYGLYAMHITTNPGLCDTLKDAILKHKNLRILKIAYKGILSGVRFPYLSAVNVTSLIEGLPYLREIEFAPDEEQMDLIAQALACGNNLSSITCHPLSSMGGNPQTDKPGHNVICGILNAFLTRASQHGSDSPDQFVWEDHYKLRNVSLNYRIFEIGSNFGKPKKGMGKPERLSMTDGDGRSYEVRFRDTTRSLPVYIHVGYDPTFEWLEKVVR